MHIVVCERRGERNAYNGDGSNKSRRLRAGIFLYIFLESTYRINEHDRIGGQRRRHRSFLSSFDFKLIESLHVYRLVSTSALWLVYVLSQKKQRKDKTSR